MTEKVYKETYISVDIEASGPIPEVYSMLSVGACVIGDTSKTFYVELKPLNDNYIQQALDVTGFSMEKLKKNGTCLLYTSPSPRDRTRSRMPSSA